MQLVGCCKEEHCAFSVCCSTPQEFEEDDFLVHEDEEDKGDEEGDEGAVKKKKKRKNKKRRQDLQLDEEDYDLLEDQGIKVRPLSHWLAAAAGAGGSKCSRHSRHGRHSMCMISKHCPWNADLRLWDAHGSGRHSSRGV
jgi:hypothetical protein